MNSEFEKILIGKAISFFYRNSMNDPYEKFHYLISINVRAIKKFECRLVCLFKFHQIKQISRLFRILIIFSGFSQDFDKTLPHFNMSNFTYTCISPHYMITPHLKVSKTKKSKILTYWTFRSSQKMMKYLAKAV